MAIDPKPKKRKYIPGRYDDKQKKAIDEPSTSEGGLALGELPAHTSLRMDAQKKGDISYPYKGRQEYAGRYEDEPEPVTPPSPKIPEPTPTVTGKIRPLPTPRIPKRSIAQIRESSGVPPKRLPPTVKWLRGKERGRGPQRRKRVQQSY